MARKERLLILNKVENLINNGNVKEARKLAMSNNLRLPIELRRKFCHKCYHYLHAKNIKVRTNPKTKAVEVTCLDCKHVNRYPYVKEKK